MEFQLHVQLSQSLTVMQICDTFLCFAVVLMAVNGFLLPQQNSLFKLYVQYKSMRT